MLFKYVYSDLYYSHKADESGNTEAYRDHTHDQYELLYFLHGDAEFYIESRRYLLKPGDLVLVEPGSHHHVHISTSSRYERYDIRFTDYIVPSRLRDVLARIEGCYDITGTVLPGLFARFDEHAERADGDLDMVKMLFRCVITEIVTYLCHIRIEEGVPMDLLKDDMKLVLDYIDRNMEKDLCLEDICQEFHYTRSYLSREFTAVMGVPIMTYIREKKIEYAEAMIATGMSPSEVSEFLGFANYSTFYRVYKKITGKCPNSTPAPHTNQSRTG